MQPHITDLEKYKDKLGNEVIDKMSINDICDVVSGAKVTEITKGGQ